MRKTDKKIDNNLRVALTEVCEKALEEVTGFKWLTHTVNYARFPESLKITCVFETNADLAKAKATQDDERLIRFIKEELAEINLDLKNIKQHITFDTEETAHSKQRGKEKQRLH